MHGAQEGQRLRELGFSNRPTMGRTFREVTPDACSMHRKWLTQGDLRFLEQSLGLTQRKDMETQGA